MYKLKKIYSLIASPTDKAIRLSIIIAAMLSLWVMYIQHGRVKDDSILYLEIAKRFADGKWGEGLLLYKWSFYPLLIAIVHKLSTLPLLVSAQLLQVGFFTLFTYSLLRLIKLAGGGISTITTGALLIFSSPSIIGVSLELLLRDFGFYAFLFFSVVHLIEFSRTSKFLNSFIWQISIIVAMLFRIEAAVYLIALPLILLCAAKSSFKVQIFSYFRANTIAIIGILLLVLLSLIKSGLFLGRLTELLIIFNGGLESINYNLHLKAEIIENQVLGRYLDGYGMFSITLTLVGIAIYKLCSVAGLIPTLAILSRGKDALRIPNNDVRLLFISIAILAVLNALYIIFSNYVLESRYILPFAIVVLFFATFALTELINNIDDRNSQSHIKVFILIFILVYSTYNIYRNLAVKRDDYNYDQDAVAWISTNRHPQENVFYNSERLKYYAGADFYKHGFDDYQYIFDSINDNSILNYDLLALSLNQHQLTDVKEKLAMLPQYRLVHEVSGYGGKKKILIYKKSTTPPQN